MVEKPIGKDTQIREQESERDRKRERETSQCGNGLRFLTTTLVVFAIFIHRSIDMDGNVVVIRIYFDFRFRNRATIYPT